MTGTQVLAMVNSFGDITINNTIGLLWLQSFIMEYSPVIGDSDTETYVGVEAATLEDVPTDFGTFIEWLYEDETYSYADKIIIRENGKIYFPYDLEEDIVMLYRPIPNYASLATEIPLDSLIHPHIWKELVSMYWDQEGEGDTEESIQMAERWHQKFEIGYLRAKNQIDNKVNTEVVACTDDMIKRARDHHSPWSAEDDYYE